MHKIKRGVNMKKAISVLVITVLLISMTGMTAFAHGGHGSGSNARQKPRYELCAVSGCDAVGAHKHDDNWYSSHTCGQGDYEVCTVKDCTQLGLHEHNGVNYYCAYHETERGCGRGSNQ